MTSILSVPYAKVEFSTTNGFRYWAILDKLPFGEGSFRSAFNGMLNGKNGNETQHITRCVIKIFKHSDKNSYEKCVCEWMASVTARYYASLFNRFYSRTNLPVVDFLIPLIARIDNVSVLHPDNNIYFTIGTFVCIEPFLIGTYQKFNSNGGYEDDKHPWMTAFCHWTWQYSSYNYMVCDLQGVYTGQMYILTDPAIHSNTKEFGITDIGPVGMNRVMNKHLCNDICHAIGLFKKLTRHDYGKKGTTYDFENAINITICNQAANQLPHQTQISPFLHNQPPSGQPISTTLVPMIHQQTQISPFLHNQPPSGQPISTTLMPMIHQQTQISPFLHNQPPSGQPISTTLMPMIHQQTHISPFLHNQPPSGQPISTTLMPMIHQQSYSTTPYFPYSTNI